MDGLTWSERQRIYTDLDLIEMQAEDAYWCDRGPCYLERGHDGRCTPG